jgi:hypothetical protein
MSTTKNNSATVTAVSKSIVAGQFNGAFKSFASNWNCLLKYYGISPQVSHKIASDCMAALGLAMSKEGADSLKATVSKANSSGEGSFKIGGKSGLTKHSYAMSIVRICQVIDSLKTEKLTSKPIKIADLEEFLNEDLTKYVSECGQWASKQEWITATQQADRVKATANAKPEETTEETTEEEETEVSAD